MDSLKAPNGNIIEHPPNGWRWDKGTFQSKIGSGEIRYSEGNTGIIRKQPSMNSKVLLPSTCGRSMTFIFITQLILKNSDGYNS